MRIMIQLLKRVSGWLATYTSLFVIAAAVLAYVCPAAFGWVQQGQRASIILGLIMLTMGCTLTTDDFRILLRRPVDILIGSVAQFTIMPLIAWTIAHMLGLNAFLSVGLILVGCCPGG